MKKQTSFFIIVCLSITLAFMGVYNLFVNYFNGHRVYELKLAQLRAQVEKEKFKNTLLTHQFKDFQQSVALILPDTKQLQSNQTLQNLASIVRTPASEDFLDLSSVIFERAMKNFTARTYDKAIADFRQLIEKYPLSLYVVKAHFFIAESQFLKKEFDKCLEQIDVMISQYPHNSLTGFILLRMGQISQYNNQPEVAKEVYQVAYDKFQDPELREQAKKLLQGIH